MFTAHNRRRRHTFTRFILFDPHYCQACWTCVETCPNHVIGKVNLFFHKHAHIDHPEACQGCLRCIKACPNQAITSRLPARKEGETRERSSERIPG